MKGIVMKLPAITAIAAALLLSACATQPPAQQAATPQAAAEQAAAPAAMEALTAQLEALDGLGVDMSSTDTGFVINMPGSMAFASGSSKVAASAQDVLDRIATAMTAVSTASAVITGHTDSLGSEASNQALSEARAEAVVAYIAGKGVDTARLSSQGMGETMPVADNGTREGRAANRRVEIVIVAE
jgi:outer membrane protein OmpA-like peptidoglycan-associated protein